MNSGRTREGACQPKGFAQIIASPVDPLIHPAVYAAMQPSSEAGITLPLYLASVSAGFPSPADDYLAKELDLNEHLIKRPAATFLVRASGNSMLNAGIHDNDLLIVDRSVPPALGKIVIVAIDGQLTVKRLQKKTDGSLILQAEHPDFAAIEIAEGNEVVIWGVVTFVIHST